MTNNFVLQFNRIQDLSNYESTMYTTLVPKKIMCLKQMKMKIANWSDSESGNDNAVTTRILGLLLASSWKTLMTFMIIMIIMIIMALVTTITIMTSV